jgi:hypothetical protein
VLQLALDEEAPKAAQELLKEIPALTKKLERAKSHVQGARAQMVINGALLVAFKLLEGACPPISALEIFFRSAAFAFSVMSVDRMLGPDADKWADLDVSAGALIEALPHNVYKALTHHRKELVGKAAALGTLVLDVKELKEAKHLVDEAKEELERVEENLERVNGWIEMNPRKLPALRLGIRNFLKVRPTLISNEARADEIYHRQKASMGL